MSERGRPSQILHHNTPLTIGVVTVLSLVVISHMLYGASVSGPFIGIVLVFSALPLFYFQENILLQTDKSQEEAFDEIASREGGPFLQAYRELGLQVSVVDGDLVLEGPHYVRHLLLQKDDLVRETIIEKDEPRLLRGRAYVNDVLNVLTRAEFGREGEKTIIRHGELTNDRLSLLTILLRHLSGYGIVNMIDQKTDYDAQIDSIDIMLGWPDDRS